MHQVIDPLASRACVAPISELSPMGAQAVAQSTLLRIHVSIGFTLMYGERLQRGEGAGLRYISRAYDGTLKLIPQIWCQGSLHCELTFIRSRWDLA